MQLTIFARGDRIFNCYLLIFKDFLVYRTVVLYLKMEFLEYNDVQAEIKGAMVRFYLLNITNFWFSHFTY